MNLTHLPDEIATPLRAYHRRKRLLQLVRVAAAAVVTYAVLLLIATHVDRFFFLTVETRRAMLWAVHGIVVGGALVWLGVLFGRPLSSRRLAYELERRIGRSAEERYVTLDDLLAREGAAAASATGVSQQLLEQLRRSATAMSERLEGARLARDPAARRLSIAAAVAVLLLTGLGMIGAYELPLMLQRFYQPGANLPRASFIDVELKPGDTTLGRGNEAVIQARVTDHTPAGMRWLPAMLGARAGGCRLLIEPADHSGQAGGVQRVEMSRVQRDLFLFTRSDLQESFRYRVRTGNAQTKHHTVRVISQPTITDLRLTVTPPEYAGLEQRTITDLDRSLRFLPGTKVELSFGADQPLSKRRIIREGAQQPIKPTAKSEQNKKGQSSDEDGDGGTFTWDESKRRGTYSFTLREPTTLRLRVTNKHGFENVDPVQVALGVREDLPPNVQLDVPANRVRAVAGELVPIRGMVEDDLGVEELAISYTLNPDPDNPSAPEELPIELKDAPVKQRELATSFDLEQTPAAPGDTLLMRIRARDTNGSDARSRPVRIEVVPFTRGAHERRRIEALEAAGRLLAAARKAKPEAELAEAIRAVSKDRYKELRDAAASAGAPLPETASLDALLKMLEAEHYLTRDPQSQRDVRMLAGCIAAARLPAGEPDAKAAANDNADGGENGGEKGDSKDAPSRIETLTDRLLPSLTAYRTAENIIWGLFGMRREAQRIAARYQELEAQQGEPKKAVMQSLKRRSQLFLDALAGAGERLIELARRREVLQPKALEEKVGQINTAGFFLGRGGLQRRRSKAQQIAGHLTELIGKVRAALPELLVSQRTARSALRKRYEAVLARIADGPEQPKEAGGWYAAAGGWLSRDATLLSREPLTPIWPRFARMALSRRLRAVAGRPAGQRAAAESQRRKEARSLMSPEKETQRLVERAERIAGAVALAHRRDELARMDRVGDRERAWEMALRRIEREAAANGWPADRIRKALGQRLPGEGEPVDAAQAGGAGDPFGEIDVAGTYEQLAEAIRQRHEFEPIAERLGALAARTAKTDERLAELVEQLRGGDEDVGATVRAVADMLAAETEALAAVVESLRLRLWLLPGAGGEDRSSLDRLLLGLRAERARYRSRARQALSVVRAAATGSLSGEQRTELSVQLPRLRPLHEAVTERVKELRSQFEQRKIDSVDPDAAEVLDRSAQLASSALAQAKEPTAERARRFVAEFEGAAPVLLTAQAPRAGRAHEAVEAMHKLAQGEGWQVSSWGERREAAQRAVAGLAEAAEVLPDGPMRQRFGGRIAQLAKRVRNLPELAEAPSEQRRSELRFELNELTGELKRLREELAGLGAQAGPRVELRRGPSAAWRGERRYDAETTARRLSDLAAYGQRHAILGMLAPLRESAGAGPSRAGYALASLRYRMLRSALAGAGGMRVGGESGETVGNALMQFLRSELEKAKQRTDMEQYAERSRIYLNLVGDFLRY